MIENYQREVIEGIAFIKKIQQELARTAEKQLELLERLVEVEHTSNDFKRTLERYGTRIEVIEDEVVRWKFLRQIITWMGPAGLIALIWIIVRLQETVQITP